MRIATLARGTILAALTLGLGVSNAATLLHSYDFTAGVIDLAGAANGTLLGDANFHESRATHP